MKWRELHIERAVSQIHGTFDRYRGEEEAIDTFQPRSSFDDTSAPFTTKIQPYAYNFIW